MVGLEIWFQNTTNQVIQHRKRGDDEEEDEELERLNSGWKVASNHGPWCIDPF